MNSKHIILAIVAQIFTLTILGQNATCKSLHTGSFKVYTEESGTTFIKRTKKQQIEKNEYLGYEVIFDITWVDECTYELRPKKLIKGDPEIMGDGSSFVRTKIKNVTTKSYIAETTASFSQGIVDFVVEIIH